uniref:Uncharacterized protein n=1 Tax=Schistocephalus solidus TaxID=70667 RepID=A0A0X3PNB1_SCHSO
MRKQGQLPACILYWCVAAQSGCLLNLMQSSQPARSIASRLQELATNAALMAKDVRKKNSRMADLLERYHIEANKAVLFFLLDAKPSCDWVDLIATFNTAFSPESPNTEVQVFRYHFGQLIASPRDTANFLQEMWRPQRETSLITLTDISRAVITCLPVTIFDKIGSEEQALFDETIRKLHTDLSALILRVLTSKQACTEQDLLQITAEASQWTTSSVI